MAQRWQLRRGRIGEKRGQCPWIVRGPWPKRFAPSNPKPSSMRILQGHVKIAGLHLSHITRPMGFAPRGGDRKSPETEAAYAKTRFSSPAVGGSRAGQIKNGVAGTAEPAQAGSNGGRGKRRGNNGIRIASSAGMDPCKGNGGNLAGNVRAASASPTPMGELGHDSGIQGAELVRKDLVADVVAFSWSGVLACSPKGGDLQQTVQPSIAQAVSVGAFWSPSCTPSSAKLRRGWGAGWSDSTSKQREQSRSRGS